MARTKKPPTRVCDWKHDENYNCYDTTCGHAFVINDGTPAENDMKYCPYCGGRLREANGKKR